MTTRVNNNQTIDKTHNEDARLTSKRGMVEFLTTIHYVEKYLKPGMRILEIGAGTGRYSMFKKTVSETFDPAGVCLPMIYEAEQNELSECLDVIHQSFSTVAEQFGLTRENCPKHTSFIPLCFLETQKNWGLENVCTICR